MSDDFMSRVRSRFRLDKDNGWIFGVCAGLANYLHTDPVYVRVGALIAAVFFTKTVIAAYLVLWLLLDERSTTRHRSTSETKRRA